MTKAELIDRIARSRDLPPDISKKLIGQILGLAFDELASYFARARVTRSSSPRFSFPHFGTFTKKRRSARRGVNPRTLEPIQIEACNTIDFKASRELREAMNPDRPDSRVAAVETDAKRESPSASSSKPGKARSSTRKNKSTKKKTKVGRRRSVAAGPSRRRLTPRDEETELAPLLDHEPIEGGADSDLPASPMQRVKGRRRPRSRGTG